MDEYHGSYVFVGNKPIIAVDLEGFKTDIIIGCIPVGGYYTKPAFNGSPEKDIPLYAAAIYVDGKYKGAFYVTRDTYGDETGLWSNKGEGLYGTNKEMPPGTYYGQRYKVNKILLSDVVGGTEIDGPDGKRTYVEIHAANRIAVGCATTEEMKELLKTISEDLDNDVKDDVRVTVIDRHNPLNAAMQTISSSLRVIGSFFESLFSSDSNEDKKNK